MDKSEKNSSWSIYKRKKKREKERKEEKKGMNPLTIVIAVVVIVLIFMIVRYVIFDPYTLQNIQNGQTASTIAANTLATNGSGVAASNFAYSMWFYINDWNYRYGEPKVLFGRMGATTTPSATTTSVPGIGGVDPCPAVVLGAMENNLSVSVGCYPGVDQEPTTPGGNTVVQTCILGNIPIQRWVNLIVSVYGRSMDLYLDGKLAKTCVLPGVASVSNNSDVYVTPAGGFNGWTAKFQYYPNPLNPQQAWNIYSNGYSSISSVLSTYQVQLSLLSNGQTQSSVTI